MSRPLVDAHSANTKASFAQPEPRRRTKQAQLVDLLSGTPGRSVAALGEALGWLPHTVRAALTGLRQKGFVLCKGKDETGTTVYRIESATGSASKPV